MNRLLANDETVKLFLDEEKASPGSTERSLRGANQDIGSGAAVVELQKQYKPHYKEIQKVFKLVSNRVLKPQDGLAINPYLKLPRNSPCYCNSGIKYKRCCLPTEPLAIPTEQAFEAKKLIDRVKRLR